MRQDQEGGKIADKQLREQVGRWAAGVLGAFGIFWIVAAARQDYFVDTPHVSLSFLPMASGVVLAVLSAIILLKPESKAKPQTSEAGEQSNEEWFGPGVFRVVLAILALLVYAILLPRVHSLATTFGIMVAGLILSGEPLRFRLLAVAFLVAVLLYGIFVIWLGVYLPGGRYS